MDNQTLFYVFGIGAAVSAVLISFVGLKVKNFPGRAFPLVILWFGILVVGATTFSVLHAQDEEHHKEAELEHANEEFEAVGNEDMPSAEQDHGPESKEPPPEDKGQGKSSVPAEQGESGPTSSSEGAASTLQLAADPSAIAYDKTELTSAPGKVTIDFTNPAPLEHDVVVEEDGKELAASEVISEGKTSATAELAAGTYTFFCSVPGHREAGMEGKLVVE
jgi:plastocyanin